jgi:phosphohistidine phosphatase
VILYLVRHGEAHPLGGKIICDDDRTLTQQGEADARLIGKVLSRLDPAVRVIATSPLVRARQTGEIIRREVDAHPVMHASERLAPGFRHEEALEELTALSAGGSIIAVAHQPDISKFVSKLIAGSPYAAISIAPCAVAKVTVKPATGAMHAEAHLHWLLTPHIVTAITSGM